MFYFKFYVEGAMHILSLCMEPYNIADLVHDENRQLLAALSRELREQNKRSHDLSLAIASCMLCFSFYRDLHDIIKTYQCGDAMFRTIENDQRKYLTRKQDLQQKQQQLNSG